MKNKILVIMLMSVLSVIFINVSVQAGVATSPKCPYFETWEPLVFDLTDNPGDWLESLVTSQGYTTFRWQDTGNDTDFEDCDRTDWDILATDVGILMIHSHGASTLIDVAANTQEDKILDPSSPYIESWTDPDGDGTADSGMGIIDHTADWGCYVAYASATCIGNTFQSTLSSNEAIVVLNSCYSAYGTNSPLKKCYGRTGFGCTGTTDAGGNSTNMQNLFGLMNGTKPSWAQGTERKAGDAYAFGEYYSVWQGGFVQEGSNDTTLCPSVEKTEIVPDSGSPFAEGSGAGTSGTGYVEFDTHCDTGVSAASALTYTKTGTVTISNIRWDTDYKISFSYCGVNPYTVNMRVEGDAGTNKVKAKDGEQHLDGGNSTTDGVAPNNHDYTFSFSY
jgi:hypothetical protein